MISTSDLLLVDRFGKKLRVAFARYFPRELRARFSRSER